MTETVRPGFPELIDNTLRSDFIKCGQLAFRSHVQNIGPITPSIHLHAGAALAKAFEVTRRAYHETHLEIPECIRLGLQKLIEAYGPINLPQGKQGDKSLDNCIRAFDSYFQQYPLESDQLVPFVAPNGKAMLEFTFSIPLELKHPQTGNPLIFAGRTDMIADRLRSGQLFVVDEKTTTQLGEQWANQWDLDSQNTGYIFAARSYGIPVMGAVIRGIGMLKTKITHAEVIVHRADWVIERWWEQLNRDVARMIRSWEEGYWDYAVDKAACNAYGGCPFKMLCESPQPDQWLSTHFRKRHWNPLAKDEGQDLLHDKELLKQLESPDIPFSDLT